MDTFFYHVLPVVTCILLGILVWIIIQWKKSAKRGAMPFCTSCSGHTDCSTTSQKKCLAKRKWYKEWGLFIKWSAGVVFCCVLFWVSMWLWFRTSTPVGNESETKTWIEAGTFGDMFGFLTCLFSGLAFSGIIISIRQQNHNLELQREAINLQCQEMKDTRAEFEAQTAQLEAQAKITKLQTYNSDLFSYLSYVNNARNDLKYSNAKGLDAILEIAALIKSLHSSIIMKLNEHNPSIIIDWAKQETKPWAIKEVHSWARIALLWFNYIDSSNLSTDEKSELKNRYWMAFRPEEQLVFICYHIYSGYIKKEDIESGKMFSLKDRLTEIGLTYWAANSDIQILFLLLCNQINRIVNSPDKYLIPKKQSC